MQDAYWRQLEDGSWQVVLDTEMLNRTADDQGHGSSVYDHLILSERTFELSCMSADPVFVDAGRVGDGRVGFEATCEPAGYMELEMGEGATSFRITKDSEPGTC